VCGDRRCNHTLLTGTWQELRAPVGANSEPIKDPYTSCCHAAGRVHEGGACTREGRARARGVHEGGACTCIERAFLPGRDPFSGSCGLPRIPLNKSDLWTVRSTLSADYDSL